MRLLWQSYQRISSGGMPCIVIIGYAFSINSLLESLLGCLLVVLRSIVFGVMQSV
jgi:hypothetical protein